MHSYYPIFAVLWIGLGALWLRRAWVGVKTPLVKTLVDFKAEPDSSGVRLGNALLGIANVVIGTVYLMKLLFKSGHLH